MWVNKQRVRVTVSVESFCFVCASVLSARRIGICFCEQQKKVQERKKVSTKSQRNTSERTANNILIQQKEQRQRKKWQHHLAKHKQIDGSAWRSEKNTNTISHTHRRISLQLNGESHQITNYIVFSHLVVCPKQSSLLFSKVCFRVCTTNF